MIETWDCPLGHEMYRVTKLKNDNIDSTRKVWYCLECHSYWETMFNMNRNQWDNK